MKRNAFYAQSGGVTSVINATAASVILEAKKHKEIGKVYAGKYGILGALREELYDTSKESISALNSLFYRPGGVFGSCRFKLKDIHTDRKEYLRLIEVFKAHNIGYFFIMVEMILRILLTKFPESVKSLVILLLVLLSRKQ